MEKRDHNFYRGAVCLLAEHPSFYNELYYRLNSLSQEEVKDLISWDEPNILDAEITSYTKYNMAYKSLDLVQSILYGKNFLAKVLRSKHQAIPYFLYDKIHKVNPFIEKYTALQIQYEITAEYEPLSPLGEIPSDALRIVVEHSDLKSLLSLRQTCKAMNRTLMDSEVFWDRLPERAEAYSALNLPIYKRLKLIGEAMIHEEYSRELIQKISPKELTEAKDLLFLGGAFSLLFGGTAAAALAFSGPLILGTAGGIAIFSGIYAAIMATPVTMMLVSLKTIVEDSDLFSEIKEFINSIKENRQLALHYKEL